MGPHEDDPLKDSDWVGRIRILTLEQAQKEPSWKASARKQLTVVQVSRADGWEPYISDALNAATVEGMNGRFVAVEFWDKVAGQIHYFAEKGGGYEGFLERDSSYPHKDASGEPVLKNWYPMAVVVPVTHNLPTPERTVGMPVLEAGRDHWLQYILFDSALTSCRMKAGDIIEVPMDLEDDELSDIENAEPRAIVKRKGMSMDGKPLITVHSFGESPFDFEKGKQGALENFARSVDMTVPEVMGTASEPTLGQEEMAATGARTSRGGLIRKLQAWGGEIVRDTAALVKLRYSAERMTKIAGPEFTKREPIIDDAGAPVMDKMGQPAMAPSIWDLWRGSSLIGDRFEVAFGATGREQDLMRAKSSDDFVALLSSQLSPITGWPRFDTAPILERESKMRNMGRLKPYKPSAEDQAFLAQQQAAQAAAVAQQGTPPEAGGPEKSGDNREAPGGGRTDGRAAGGKRGPPPVPGRQGRGEMPGDVGDQSVRVHRVSTQ